MSRKLRFMSTGGSLVEVTCRTVQGRRLMRPSPQLNEIILGVLPELTGSRKGQRQELRDQFRLEAEVAGFPPLRRIQEGTEEAQRGSISQHGRSAR